MKRITDPTFRYTRAIDTDVGKTFAKARRRMREEREAQARADAEAAEKVSPMPRQAKGR
jgi:hypothetical protein